MYETFKSNVEKRNDLIFYEVSEEAIRDAEKRMGFRFPKSLETFYREIGYGFIKGSPNFINRIMAPEDIADFVCDSEEYEFVDKSIYDEDELVFMHLSDEDFLTIEYKDGNGEVIKYFGDIIAYSFEEFLEKILEKPNYYIDK